MSDQAVTARYPMRRSRKLPVERWPEFLKHLAETGLYSAAATALDVSQSTVMAIKREDPDFSELCDEALERYKKKLIDAATKRAVEGYEVPIVGGRERDRVVATEVRYSDRLMELLLKRADPSFREKSEVTIRQETGLEIRRSMNLRELSPRARKKLRELLEIIKEDKIAAAEERMKKNLAIEAQATEVEEPR